MANEELAANVVINHFDLNVMSFYDVVGNMPMLVYLNEVYEFDENVRKIVNALSFERTGSFPNNPRGILDTLEMRAKNNPKRLYLRTAFIKGSLRYKLDDYNEVIVGKEGWKCQKHDNNEFIFRPSDISGDQVSPIRTDKNLYELLEHLPVTEDTRILLMGTLVHALFKYPHPIINVVGPHGSGKSTVISYLRDIIDPTNSGFVEVDADVVKDIKINLGKTICFIYDNKRAITDNMSDLFAQVSTNAIFRLRQLYHTMKMVATEISSTIFVAGVIDIMRHPDILSRTVKFTLTPLEKRDNADVLYIRPEIVPETLGAIFDVIHYIMNRPIVDESATIRLSEYYWTTVAAAEFCGISRSQVNNAFALNDYLVAEQSMESSFVGQWLSNTIDPGSEWTGNATKMFKEMTEYGKISIGQCPYKSAIGLGRKLDEIKTAAVRCGFNWETDKKSKVHKILRVDEE